MTIRADDEEETKLHVAVRMHNLKLVRAALRDRGLDIDALGTCGWTALHEAASCGYQDIVELLLENGADPNIQDSVQKCTPIHLAARKGHLEVVRSLVQSGARLDLKNSERKIPQDYAQEQCRVFLMRQRKYWLFKTSGHEDKNHHIWLGQKPLNETCIINGYECIICAIQKRKSDLLNAPEYLNCLKMFFEYPDKVFLFVF